MKIQEISSFLESYAPLSLQESYDNAGLLTGNKEWECTGIITTLDATEEVVLEAVSKNCNLIVAHHPIIFGGLKRINGYNYIEKTLIAAIKNNIAIYAIHTNLDNVLNGVNARIADQLGLVNRKLMLPKKNQLKKLITFIPLAQAEFVREAIFAAGGGHIGKYAECSFTSNGEGSFQGNEGADPFIGSVGKRHIEQETRVEVIFEAYNEKKILSALIKAHPYEEVAYDIISLDNTNQQVGSGLMGELLKPAMEIELLEKIKRVFGLSVIRHTPLLGKMVSKIAICGGAGSFLIEQAIAIEADMYITADIKYHEFFDANNKLVIADIGHFESEQFTIDLLFDILSEKFLNFAVQKTGVKTNPVQYF